MLSRTLGLEQTRLLKIMQQPNIKVDYIYWSNSAPVLIIETYGGGLTRVVSNGLNPFKHYQFNRLLDNGLIEKCEDGYYRVTDLGRGVLKDLED
jgi:hypothetical protein